MTKHLTTILLIGALLIGTCAAANAQGKGNVICPTAAPGTSDNRCASTAFVQGALPFAPITIGTTPVTGGTSGYILYNAAGVAGNEQYVPLASGGTNAGLTASIGGIFYSGASAGAILSGTATAQQMLQSGASGAPAWSTATWPATTTAKQLLYSSATNVVGGLAFVNAGMLQTDSSGNPQWTQNPNVGGTGIGTGSYNITGTISGRATITVQNAAGTPTLTLGTNTGTPAVTATSPLAITAATGDIACATCFTTSSLPLSLANGGLGASQAGATAGQVPLYPGSSGAAVPTSVSCTPIAGLVGNGTTDNLAAINAAITALGTSNGCLSAPSGKFDISAQVSVALASGQHIRIVGSGPEATRFYWPNATGGFAFTLADNTASFDIENFSCTTAQHGGGNCGTFTQTADSTYPAEAAPNVINNVVARGDDGFSAGADYWNTGFAFSKVSNVSLNFVSTYGSNAVLGNGVTIDGKSTSDAVVYNFTNFYSYANAIGIEYGVTSGYVQGVTITNSNFTGCTACISSPRPGGVGLAGLSELLVSNSQIASVGTSSFGIVTNSAIQFISLTNNLFLNGGDTSFGVALIHNQEFTISNNSFQGYGFVNPTGLYVASTDAQLGYIGGNNFDNLTVGINLDTAATGVTIGQNVYSTVTFPWLNAGTGNFVPTGTGSLVYATSPTLVTPALGTPSSGVATNLTGTASGLTAGNVTTNANLTGPVTSAGNATSFTATAWTATTPTPVCAAGTPTTITAHVRTLNIGKTWFWTATVTFTTINTCTTGVYVPLGFTSVNALNQVGAATQNTTGVSVNAIIAPNSTSVLIYANGFAFPATNGQTIVASGVFEGS